MKGSSQPLMSTRTLSISQAARAAIRCSTWRTLPPAEVPSMVTSSAASAFQGSAAIAGAPGRSTRRNRIPEPSAAGRSVTATLAPLWRPTPAQPIV